MHESSIVESIIKTISEKAVELNARAITKVSLVVGDDSGFMGDSIQFYFDRYSKDTIASGAVLEMKFVKPKLRCPACGALFERKMFEFKCPHCNAEGLPTQIGKECYIENIEIVEAEEK